MMQMLLAAAGVAWSGVAIESLVETILVPGSAIRAFGRSIAVTGPREEIIVVTVVGITVGAVLAVTATRVVQSLRSSSLRAELERRDGQLAVAEAALAAKNDLLSWRVSDLQRQADVLLARRDELLDKLSDVETRTIDLRTKTRGTNAIARLSRGLVAMPDLEAVEDLP